MGMFDPFGTFRTLRNLPIRVRDMRAVFWEHNFRTVPFEMVVSGLARRGSGSSLRRIGRTWISRSDLAELGYTPRYQDGVRSEIGVSLNGIFGLLRVDATKRIDANGMFAGVGLARLF